MEALLRIKSFQPFLPANFVQAPKEAQVRIEVVSIGTDGKSRSKVATFETRVKGEKYQPDTDKFEFRLAADALERINELELVVLSKWVLDGPSTWSSGKCSIKQTIMRKLLVISSSGLVTDKNKQFIQAMVDIKELAKDKNGRSFAQLTLQLYLKTPAKTAALEKIPEEVFGNQKSESSAGAPNTTSKGLAGFFKKKSVSNQPSPAPVRKELTSETVVAPVINEQPSSGSLNSPTHSLHRKSDQPLVSDTKTIRRTTQNNISQPATTPSGAGSVSTAPSDLSSKYDLENLLVPKTKSEEEMDKLQYELERRTVAIKKLGEDLVDTREQVNELKDKNITLSLKLRKYEELMERRLTEPQMRNIPREELVQRFIMVEQNLDENLEKMGKLQLKIEELQEKLVEKQDVERKFIELENAHTVQQKLIQQLQENAAYGVRAKSVVADQEKIIRKLEQALDRRRNGSRPGSPRIVTEPQTTFMPFQQPVYLQAPSYFGGYPMPYNFPFSGFPAQPNPSMPTVIPPVSAPQDLPVNTSQAKESSPNQSANASYSGVQKQQAPAPESHASQGLHSALPTQPKKRLTGDEETTLLELLIQENNLLRDKLVARFDTSAFHDSFENTPLGSPPPANEESVNFWIQRAQKAEARMHTLERQLYEGGPR